jgi:hypothetical protein
LRPGGWYTPHLTSWEGKRAATLRPGLLTASLRLVEYTRNPAVPFYVWLRRLTGQQLALLHRHHIGTKQRDAWRCGRHPALPASRAL